MAWYEAVSENSQIIVNNVYDLNRDWNFDVVREQQLLLDHDRIVFQQPFLWYSTPPLMKKWFDDVLGYGWAYGPGGTMLKGKSWISAISTGGPADSYQSGGYNHYSMSELLKPLQQTANLIGMKFLPPFIFHNAVRANDNDIKQSAKNYVDHILNPHLDPSLRLIRLLNEMAYDGQTLGPTSI